MKIKVIEVVIDGAKKFVVGTSIFGEQPTDDLMKAKNYDGNDKELMDDLSVLVVPGDSGYAKSGLRIEKIPMVVEYEVEVKELRRDVGRLPRM